MKRACFPALVAAAALAAANPFAGAWKLNPAKSNFAGDTIKFTNKGSGLMELSEAGLSYAFKIDGKEYPALFGSTAAWKQLDAHTWETANNMNGKMLSTDTLKLSQDGKTLTLNSKGAKPNGDAFDNHSVYQRVSGEAGLQGTWKSTEVKVSSPNTIQFADFGGDGLTLTFPDFKASGSAKFDGKDYPITGPTVPAGITFSLKHTGPRAFEMVEKEKGKPLFTVKYTVSADGRTLTEVGTPVAVDEPTTAVYERQ